MAKQNPLTGQWEDDFGNPIPAPSDNPLIAMNPVREPRIATPADMGAPSTPPPAPIAEPPGAQPIAPPPPIATPSPLPTQPTMHKESSTTTRIRKVAAPGEAGALAAVNRGYDEQAGAIAEEGELQGRKAGVVAEGQAEIAKQTRQKADDTTTTLALGKQREARAQELAKQAEKEYNDYSAKIANEKPQDYYAGRTGRRIGDAILVGLGELGRGLAAMGGIHTQNTALDIIRENHAQWYIQEKDRIAGLKERKGDLERNVARAERGVDREQSATQRALQNLEIRAAANINAVQQTMLAKADEIGTEFAKNKARKDAAVLQTVKNEHLLNYQEGLRQELHTTDVNVNATGVGAGAGGKATESQAKLALLAQQMQGELDTIKKNPQIAAGVLDKMQARGLATAAADKEAEGSLVGTGKVALLRGLKVIPKSKYEKMSDQEQLVANAWDNAVEKYARVLTGSGMPADEARRLALQDAPHAGDSQVVIAQKFARMQAFAKQAMSLAGPAASQIAPAAQGAASGGLSDQQAVQMARQRLKANPNDAVAKRVLQMHGEM